MMTPLPETFTSEELAALGVAARTYVGIFKDTESPVMVPELMDLVEKIERLRLLGKKVRFTTNSGKEQVGELLGYLDWEDMLMARVRADGLQHFIPAKSQLHGEA